MLRTHSPLALIAQEATLAATCWLREAYGICLPDAATEDLEVLFGAIGDHATCGVPVSHLADCGIYATSRWLRSVYSVSLPPSAQADLRTLFALSAEEAVRVAAL